MTPLDYAARGLAVFPCFWPVINGTARCACGRPECPDAAKHPFPRLAPNGFKSASKEPKQINRWACGPYNVAVATGAVSGVVVLDIDPRHGGADGIARLEAEHGALPAIWHAFTGSGGEHIYFAHPGRRVPCSEGRIAAGIDVRGDDGYVIAPPSRHISGRCYAWDVDRHPDDIPLAAMPGWLLEKVVEPADKPKDRFPPSPVPDWPRR